MSDDHEGRIARLERTVEHGLGLSLHEHDDADQAAEHAKQLEQDKADQEAQLEQLRADAVAAALPSQEDIAATEAAKALAAEHGVDLTQVEGTGAEGQIIKPDVAAAVEEA